MLQRVDRAACSDDGLGEVALPYVKRDAHRWDRVHGDDLAQAKEGVHDPDGGGRLRHQARTDDCLPVPVRLQVELAETGISRATPTGCRMLASLHVGVQLLVPCECWW